MSSDSFALYLCFLYQGTIIGERPRDGKKVVYKDAICVGYRYFDTYHAKPLFALGYGLSYTHFSLNNMKVQTDKKIEARVSITIKNIGKVAGAEVVQLYVHDGSSSLPRPEKELKAFREVFLLPREEKEVFFDIYQDGFQYYDDRKMAWVAEPEVLS